MSAIAALVAIWLWSVVAPGRVEAQQSPGGVTDGQLQNLSSLQFDPAQTIPPSPDTTSVGQFELSQFPYDQLAPPEPAQPFNSSTSYLELSPVNDASLDSTPIWQPTEVFSSTYAPVVKDTCCSNEFSGNIGGACCNSQICVPPSSTVEQT